MDGGGVSWRDFLDEGEPQQASVSSPSASAPPLNASPSPSSPSPALSRPSSASLTSSSSRSLNKKEKKRSSGSKDKQPRSVSNSTNNSLKRSVVFEDTVTAPSASASASASAGVPAAHQINNNPVSSTTIVGETGMSSSSSQMSSTRVPPSTSSLGAYDWDAVLNASQLSGGGGDLSGGFMNTSALTQQPPRRVFVHPQLALTTTIAGRSGGLSSSPPASPRAAAGAVSGSDLVGTSTRLLSGPGRVVVIEPFWQWDDLIRDFGRRFGDVVVTDVFLASQGLTRGPQPLLDESLLILDSLDSIRDGDTLVVRCLAPTSLQIAKSSTVSSTPRGASTSTSNGNGTELSTLLARAVDRLEAYTRTSSGSAAGAGSAVAALSPEIANALKQTTEIQARQANEMRQLQTLIQQLVIAQQQQAGSPRANAAEMQLLQIQQQQQMLQYQRQQSAGQVQRPNGGAAAQIRRERRERRRRSNSGAEAPEANEPAPPENEGRRPKKEAVEHQPLDLSFRKVHTFREHEGPVWVLKMFSDLLISGSGDSTIRVWDMHNFKLRHVLIGHQNNVRGLAIHNNGTHLISGSDDKSLRVWDLQKMICVNAIHFHTNSIVELMATQKYIMSASHGAITVWDAQEVLERPNLKPITELRGFNHWVYSMTPSKLEPAFLFAGSHNMIKKWFVQPDDAQEAPFNGFHCDKTIVLRAGKSIYSLATSRDYLLAGTYDNYIFVLNSRTLELVRSISEHQGNVLSLAVSGPVLFSGSYDTTVKAWAADTLQHLETLQHGAKVEALTCSDKFVISGGTDHKIHVWQWSSKGRNAKTESAGGLLAAAAKNAMADTGSDSDVSWGEDDSLEVDTVVFDQPQQNGAVAAAPSNDVAIAKPESTAAPPTTAPAAPAASADPAASSDEKSDKKSKRSLKTSKRSKREKPSKRG